jgi:rubredoxin-NAD+ reductase
MVWECLICNWRYDQEEGLPMQGIAPATRFEEIPHEWSCPECGASKDDFVELEAQA